MFDLFLSAFKWLTITALIVMSLSIIFFKLSPEFGGKPNKASYSRIAASPNYNGKTFVNLTQTQARTVDFSQPISQSSSHNGSLFWQFIFPPKGKNPNQPIKTLPLNLIDNLQIKEVENNKLNKPYLNTTLQNGEFVWLGHSTVLFKTAGKLLITDPVFHRASPVPIGGKPFEMTHTPSVQDLPNIDVVLISHDHYDHLDYKAIKEIKAKVEHFYVPLGVKAHLVRWGVEESKISEFDWYENTKVVADNNQDIEITFTPSRHFSGRGVTGHRETLWGSWVVQSPQLSVYFSGDGGYSDEFAKIGQRFGGFDIAFIEDGAYNERWRDVHMLPEESAQAGIDLNAKVILPIHWGKFDLSTHNWREPVRRITSAIDKYNQTVESDKKTMITTPRIGEVFNLSQLPMSPWWEQQH